MNQIDETRPGAGREIERTWQRLRAQDADPHAPEIGEIGEIDDDADDLEDEANDLEHIIENDELLQPGLLDDPMMEEGGLVSDADDVPTEEPEYGDHRDTRIRQDDEMIDADLLSSSRTAV